MLAKVVIFDLGRHHSAATSSPPIEKLFVSLSGLQLPNPLRLQLVILAGFFLTIYRINKRTGRQETVRKFLAPLFHPKWIQVGTHNGMPCFPDY
jgi:hypothetical protein